MAKLLRYLFLLLFVAISGTAFAQTGAISGTILDEKKETVIGAVVEVSQGGIVRGGAVTDADGKYVIKPLNPGTNYEISVKYTGYQEQRQTGVQITSNITTYLNFNLKVVATDREEVVVTAYKVPLIKKDEPGTTTTITGEQFAKMATRNTNDAVSLAGGTYQSKNGAGISIGGARTNGTQYIIDGQIVLGSAATNFPPNTIDQISVITSGLPAKYGDALGGVVNISTKGSSPTTMGGVGFEHSVDGYNHNLAFFNISGPLIKKKDSLGNKRPLLGYSLGGQYLYDGDDNPNYYNNYVVNSGKLSELRATPLKLGANSQGNSEIRYAAEDVRMSDLETRKQRINAETQNATVTGKLDLQVSNNANLTAGGNFNYTKTRAYSPYYSLFSPDAIPSSKGYTGRGYLRFTQRLGKPYMPSGDGEEKTKPSLISNAYYSIQADYSREYSETEDPSHKKNAFNYGYVGKFNTSFVPLYTAGIDSNVNLPVTQLQTYLAPVGVDFQRSEMNPNLANYTSQVYDFANSFGVPIQSLDQIQQYRGLLNGQQPIDVYGLYGGVGRSLSGYSYGMNEQFAFTADASFDLQTKKVRHAIEFGLYYQQRSERGFGFNRASESVSIWNAMRLLQNQHLVGLDNDNPIFIKNGQEYTEQDVKNGVVTINPTDTVIYRPRFDAGSLSTFSKNLRNKLGLDPSGTDYINIDALDPSTFSLDMFSADELLNSGERFVNYYGYDYTGKRLDGQVNFNDWFTKKDANGNYTREVGAFRPNYIAGYIMDKFELGSSGTLFNVGLRVDRFDANTKVLKDPYSLYAVETVATSNAINRFNGNTTPTNMGSDYVVYVADNSATLPEVVGYRNGDDWYDPYGRPLADPSDITRLYSDGRVPQPYLQRTGGNRALTMRDTSYNPATSFTDYKPQVNVMPRLSFTFPIADQSMFYAHYDVIVQRPKSVGQIYATPYDYYYLTQNTFVANPDLKPEKMFDYELGFQQALNRFSAVTITGFYKERKDMIQMRPYLYAWPITYFTYGNRDFSTTKGFIFKYDLRRISHIQAFLSYTLQFVEGTASSADGSSALLNNLITAQLPNLRFTYPLNVDSRHIFNVNLDYRYDKGEGPIVGKTHILENAGANLIFRARSGEPYTRYLNAIPSNTTIVGGIQNSRLPWHYMMDLRVEKQFDVYVGKKDKGEGASNRRPLGMMAFVYIQNLLNTRDVLSVYRYTGRPDDNGFLASANGQQNVDAQNNPEAFTELYNISLQNSAYLNNPRRINLGISLNF